MADGTRSKTRLQTGIPLPRGKENVRPSTVAAATGKRVLLGNAKETVRRTRVSVDRATSSRTNHAFSDTLAVKKIPFQIHCDEKNVPSERETREESRIIQNVANSTKRERSIVDDGTIDESRSDKKPPLSKIPRRSRSCSISTDKKLSRQSTLDLPESTLTEVVSKIRTLKRLLGEVREEKYTAGAVAPSMQIEPTIQESKVPKIAGVVSLNRPKEQDCVPIELLYNVEYHEDLPIVEQQREERSVPLSRNFLRNGINAEQRRLVVIFMIHVGRHCRYPSFVVCQAIKLFDVVLDKIPLDTKYVQLSALACLWIALKKQEHFHRIPTASALVSLAKELYADREDLLIDYEKKILLTLNFNVTFADPFSLYNHHMINCRRCIEISEETAVFLYYCGGYLIDVTLLDEQFCRISSSLVAVTAAELALGLAFDAVHENARPRWLFWRGILFANVPCLSGRFRDKEIDQCRITIFRRVLISVKKHCGFEVVYKKYSSSRFGRIAEPLVERAHKISLSESFDP